MKWISAITVPLIIVGMIMGSSSIEAAKLCNNGGVWRPSPGMPWMWMIGKTPSTSQIDASNAQAVDLDMFGTSSTLIDYIHSKGKAMICYIDTAYEPGRPDSASFTAAVKGSGIDGWPGQYWVDIRSSVVRNIMAARVQTAAAKGCDAIEWDDVDAYSNANGLGLTYADQISFNTYLTQITHTAGMSVGLKNDLDQVSDLVNYYDWALNEQCYQYNECSVLSKFINQGKAVFGTEYQGDAATFCPAQNALHFSWLKSSLNLDGTGVTQCCSYASPACPSATYSCVNSTYMSSPTATPTPTTKPTTSAPTTAAPTTAAPTTKPTTSAPTSKPTTSAPTPTPAASTTGRRHHYYHSNERNEEGFVNVDEAMLQVGEVEQQQHSGSSGQASMIMMVLAMVVVFLHVW